MNVTRLSDRHAGACFPAVEACYSWTWNDFHMNPHSHDRAEIMYLLRGKCTVHVYGHDSKQEFRLNVGEFIYIDAGVVHALDVTDQCYMTNVEFRLLDGSNLLTIGKLRAQSPVFDCWLNHAPAFQQGRDLDGSFYGALSSVIDDFSGAEKTDAALRELHLGQMLILAAKALSSSGKELMHVVHVRRCDRLLSERMGEEIRIDDIAAQIGVSTAYLQRIFRRVHGMTMIDYLNRLRIERAKLLLKNTGDAIVDIAVASGFNSRQHFCRVFRAVEGCSPTEYRTNTHHSETKQVFLFP